MTAGQEIGVGAGGAIEELPENHELPRLKRIVGSNRSGTAARLKSSCPRRDRRHTTSPDVEGTGGWAFRRS